MNDILLNISEVGLSPRPTIAFNETIRNAHVAMYFNDEGNRLLPEKVRNNMFFFSALSITGVYPVGARIRPYYNPHNDNFACMAGLQFVSRTEPVVGFKIPELKYPYISKTVLGKTMTLCGPEILGYNQHVIQRVTDEVVGLNVICFGIEFATRTQYYMWDRDNIYEVQTTAPAWFKRTKEDKLVLMTDKEDSYTITGVPFERRVWTNLCREVIDTPKNIVVEVDFAKYSVPIELPIVLRIENEKLVLEREKQCIMAVKVKENVGVLA